MVVLLQKTLQKKVKERHQEHQDAVAYQASVWIRTCSRILQYVLNHALNHAAGLVYHKTDIEKFNDPNSNRPEEVCAIFKDPNVARPIYDALTSFRQELKDNHNINTDRVARFPLRQRYEKIMITMAAS
jgi:hypothetical protein